MDWVAVYHTRPDQWFAEAAPFARCVTRDSHRLFTEFRTKTKFLDLLIEGSYRETRGFLGKHEREAMAPSLLKIPAESKSGGSVWADICARRAKESIQESSNETGINESQHIPTSGVIG